MPANEEQYYQSVLVAVQEISQAMRTMREQVSGEAAAQIAPLARAVGRLETLMYGDAQARQVGTLEELSVLKRQIDAIQDDLAVWKQRLRTIAWLGTPIALIILALAQEAIRRWLFP